MLFASNCPACGRPGNAPCRRCLVDLRRPPLLPAPPGLDRLFALFSYVGAGRELVARLKYRGARASVPWLAAGMARLVADAGDTARPAVVTWVPTTSRRRRDRGFDQAELLARRVAAHLGLPCIPLLHRGPGPPQTGRSAEERRCPPPVAPTLVAPSLVAGRRVLVIDDVCTTGATLTAAAMALRRAGAVSVTAAVAARTPSRHSEPGSTLTHGPRAGRR